MAKRAPTSDLNHENWNQEEEAEEAGHFQVASSDELKERKFLKPKRRLAQPTSTGSSSGANPFTAFSSFGAAVAATGTAKPFETFSFGNVSSGSLNNDSSEAKPAASTVPEPSPSPTGLNIFGGSIENSPTTSSNEPEPAKFSFATGLPFTPPEKSSTVSTTTPSWKFGIDVNEDTEPDSTAEKSNEEAGLATDSTTEASNESERVYRDQNSNDVPVSESDKSSELTNMSLPHNDVNEDEEEEPDEPELEPDSTEREEEDSRSKDLED